MAAPPHNSGCSCQAALLLLSKPQPKAETASIEQNGAWVTKGSAGGISGCNRLGVYFKRRRF